LAVTSGFSSSSSSSLTSSSMSDADLDVSDALRVLRSFELWIFSPISSSSSSSCFFISLGGGGMLELLEAEAVVDLVLVVG